MATMTSLFSICCVIFKKNTHFDKCHLLSFMLISSWHTEHINKDMFRMEIQLQACLSKFKLKNTAQLFKLQD